MWLCYLDPVLPMLLPLHLLASLPFFLASSMPGNPAWLLAIQLCIKLLKEAHLHSVQKDYSTTPSSCAHIFTQASTHSYFYIHLFFSSQGTHWRRSRGIFAAAQLRRFLMVLGCLLTCIYVCVYI